MHSRLNGETRAKLCFPRDSDSLTRLRWSAVGLADYIRRQRRKKKKRKILTVRKIIWISDILHNNKIKQIYGESVENWKTSGKEFSMETNSPTESLGIARNEHWEGVSRTWNLVDAYQCELEFLLRIERSFLDISSTFQENELDFPYSHLRPSVQMRIIIRLCAIYLSVQTI